MPLAKHKIAPCLWFDGRAEEAARYYCSVFKNSRMGRVSYFPDSSQYAHGQQAGSVLMAEFELDGQPFYTLNGGPQFTFDEAVSFQIYCETQDEIDYYWNALTGDGGEEGPCGWLKDKFGLSWQVVPRVIPEMMCAGGDKAARVMDVFMQMKKLDLAEIERTYAGH